MEIDTGVLTVIIVAAVVAADASLRIASLVVVPRNRRPQTAIAWLMAIFFIPIIGLPLFLLVGRARLPRTHRTKQREVNEFIRESTEGFDRVRRDPPWPPWLEPIVELNRTLGAMPLVGGNSARMWTDDAESLAAMTADIRAARKTVHVEF